MRVCRHTGKEDKAKEDWKGKLCLRSEVYDRDSVSWCVLQPVDGWSVRIYRLQHTFTLIKIVPSTKAA